jgi:hypothetical protein
MSININRNLPGNAYDAAVGANTPSVTNPYATQLDLANINNPGRANLLISGGASWSDTGMVFNVSALVYQIAGIQLSANAQNVTLPASNPTLPRFDAIVVNDIGVVSVISGTPATNPLTPAVDENYVLIQYVLVGAGSTTPTVTNEFVYREGLTPDWNPSSVAGAAPALSVNFSSTTPAPVFQGSQCTLVTAPTYSSGKYIQYTKPTGNISRTTFAFLTFRVYLPVALPARNIQIFLYNGTTLIGSVLATNWGMNMNSIGNWQLVSIPTNAFGNLAISTMSMVRIFMTGTTANTFATNFDRYALDDVKFQSGFGPQANVATIDLTENANAVGSTSKINFISGAGVDWAIVNDAINNRINVAANSINAYVTPELNIAGRILLNIDAGKFLMVDSASPQTMTIQLNSNFPIPTGAVIKVSQQGTGTVTILGVIGVTLYTSIPGPLPGQYSVATLTKTDTDTWYIEYSLV